MLKDTLRILAELYRDGGKIIDKTADIYGHIFDKELSADERTPNDESLLNLCKRFAEKCKEYTDSVDELSDNKVK